MNQCEQALLRALDTVTVAWFLEAVRHKYQQLNPCSHRDSLSHGGSNGNSICRKWSNGSADFWPKKKGRKGSNLYVVDSARLLVPEVLWWCSCKSECGVSQSSVSIQARHWNKWAYEYRKTVLCLNLDAKHVDWLETHGQVSLLTVLWSFFAASICVSTSDQGQVIVDAIGSICVL